MQEGTKDATEDQQGNPTSAAGEESVEISKEDLCQQGMAAYSTGDFRKAIRLLEQGLSGEHVDWKAHACLGLSYFQEGQTTSAQNVFEFLVSNCPDEAIKLKSTQALDKIKQHTASLLSTPVEQAGDEDGGIELTAEAPAETAAADTGKTDAPMMTAEEYLAMERRQKAAERQAQPEGVEIPDQPSQIPPDLSGEEKLKYCKWGTNCYLDNKYEKAIEYLEQGLSGEEQKENWNARLCLGMSYFKVENFACAAQILQSLISECPDPKVTTRARQALDNVKLTELYPDQEGGEAIPAALARQKAKRKAHDVQLILPSAGGEAPAETGKRRKANPLAIPILAVIVVGWLYYGALNMLPSIYSSMFLPPQSVQLPGVEGMGTLAGCKPKELRIPTAHAQTLAAVLYSKSDKVVIIHSGTFDDYERRKSIAEAFITAGFSVIAYDPRGFAASSGQRNWEGIADDGLFVYEYLNGKLGYSGASIISYGCSLGSAPAALTGTRRAHKALIIENPFTSLPELAKSKNPLLALFPDDWCPQPHLNIQQMLGLTHAPLLVVISKDPIVPSSQSSVVYSRASDPKELKDTGVDANTPHWDTMIKFLQR